MQGMSADLTSREQDALDVLHDEPAVSPTLLADELGIERQNAYHLLQSLIEAGECRKKARGIYTRQL